jgi:hypothetical protein
MPCVPLRTPLRSRASSPRQPPTGYSFVCDCERARVKGGAARRRRKTARQCEASPCFRSTAGLPGGHARARSALESAPELEPSRPLPARGVLPRGARRVPKLSRNLANSEQRSALHRLRRGTIRGTKRGRAGPHRARFDWVVVRSDSRDLQAIRRKLRLARRCFTRERSLVRTQPRPLFVTGFDRAANSAVTERDGRYPIVIAHPLDSRASEPRPQVSRRSSGEMRRIGERKRDR